MVALADTGTGMDAETIARAFEPFFTTKPVGKGSGLGLSQVYGFVTSSQGFAKIDSAPGRGTTVRLYLPQVPPEAVEAEVQKTDAPIPQAKGEEIVLVVEDDSGVLEMAIESLQELGYSVITASNAADALTRIRGNAQIDVLFSDIVMPGDMNGVELAAEVHRVRPGLNILLTSGYAAGALSNMDELPEGVEIIAKPYRLDSLAQALRRIIDGNV
jgi:CheY-like chemotaxis protein